MHPTFPRFFPARAATCSQRWACWRAARLICVMSAALALILTTLTPAQAQRRGNKRAEAQEVFKRGQGYFVEGRYSEAAVEFLNAFQLDPHPAIMYNVARAHEEMGQLIKALQYYRVALSLKPSSAVKEELERKIAELEVVLRADGVDVLNLDTATWVPTGRVSISSNPPGAQVTINGDAAGRTPMDARTLPQGEYVIRLTRKGFQPEERRLEVVGGKSYVLSPELRPGDEFGPARAVNPGMIDVVVDQRGLTVFIDGEPTATTPVGLIELTPGQHTVSVEGEGFPTFEEVVSVEGGQTVRVQVRRPGLELKAEPDDGTLSRSGWGWVAVGGGGAMLATGGLLGILALNQADAYNTDRSNPGRPVFRDNARRLGIGADVSYVAGAALIATGALLLTLDGRASSAEDDPQNRPAYMDDFIQGSSLRVTPQVLPGGAGVGAEINW